MTTEKDHSDPSSEPRQRLEQAYSHIEKDEFEDALRECEIATHLAPEWAEAHNLRGIILEELGQEEQAIVAYQEAVRLAPDFQEARQNLVELELEYSDRRQGPTTCWFCKKRLADTASAILVELHKMIDSEWVSQRVLVPRCNNCRRWHRVSDMALRIAIVIGVLAAIAYLGNDMSRDPDFWDTVISNPVTLVVYLFIGAAFGGVIYLPVASIERVLGIKPIEYQEEHSAVGDLKSAGFSTGGKPSGLR